MTFTPQHTGDNPTGGPCAVDCLTDTAITNAVDGDTLVLKGGKWVNVPKGDDGNFFREYVKRGRIHMDSVHLELLDVEASCGGFWALSGQVTWNNAPYGVNCVFLSVNDEVVAKVKVPAVSTLGISLQISTMTLLKEGDVVTLSAYQNSGEVVNVLSGNGNTWLSGALLRRA